MKQLGMSYSSLTRLNYHNNSQANPVKIKIGEEEKLYYVISESITQGHYWPNSAAFVYEYQLQEVSVIKVRTKEQIAAEESVAKAKEALLAAENTLKAVKENVK